MEKKQEEEKPFFTHDCKKCIFLGNLIHKDKYRNLNEAQFDLYFCPSNHRNSLGNTLIARYDNDGPEYMSGFEFALSGVNPILIEAFNRASKRNLLNKPIIYVNPVLLNLYLDDLANDSIKQKIPTVKQAILKYYKYIYNIFYPDLWDRIDNLIGCPVGEIEVVTKFNNFIKNTYQDITSSTDIIMSLINYGMKQSTDTTELKNNEIQLALFTLKQKE